MRTLDELIDTKALGKMAHLVVGLLTGLSEVERSLIQERSRKSVERRRKTGGNLGGRPRPQTKKSPWSCVCVKKVSPIGPSWDQTGLALATITCIIKEEEVA